MLKRGTRTARLGIAIAGAAAMSLLAAGSAMAAQQPVIGADVGGINSYSQATYTMDQGEFLQFQNMGPSNEHDVWSRADGPDKKKLFISPTILPGNVTTVAGTQYLTANAAGYPFFCNVHPFEMSGNLVVTGNGTPVPRPDIEVTVTSTKLDKVAKKGKLLVKVQALSTAQNVSLEAKLGKLLLGSIPDLDLQAGQTRKATVKIKKSGKSKLAAKEKATVKVTGNVAFGSPDTAKKKLT
jgi:hypothetical protein